MSNPAAPPGRSANTPQAGEAYVLSLLAAGKFEIALEVIAELGDGRVYWPDFYNHAQRLLAAGLLDGAVASLDAAMSLDPDRAETYELMGEVRLRQRQWAAAEECFRRALERNRRLAAAWYGLGRALRQRGKRRQALEALVTAMEADPRPEWKGEVQAAMRRGDHPRGRSPRSANRDALLGRAQGAIARAIECHCAQGASAVAAPTLSVCMIVRDEEDSLGRCLASVRGLASEIIVVDTGSRDRTVEIADRFSARVHHYEWCDDFASARNQSLRHATGDWILVLDADDELGDPAGLKQYLASAEAVNVCALRTRIPHRGQVGETIVEHPRLFRNRLGFHYRSPVHEQLCDAHGNPAVADAALDLCVYHHGYLESEPEQGKREQRNLRILRGWVARTPDDAWGQFCLGQAYYTQREMELAIPALTAALEHSAPDRAYRAKAYAYLASAQAAAGRPEQAEQTCASGLREFAEQPELLFCLGHALERQGRREEAITAYEAATRGRFGAMLAHHDFTCRDLKPLVRLADLHAGDGRFDQAEECLRRAERIRGAVPALAALRERIASARHLSERTHVGQDVVAAARTAVEANRDDVGARVRLAAAMLGSGNLAQAEREAGAALELDPASPEALNLQGLVLCARGDYAAAAEHFQRAAALRPDYADALCNLGAARLRADDIARAEMAFRQAVEADASCFAAHLALAEIAQARGDNDAAIAGYESALRAETAEPAAWLGLARSYMQRDAYEPAARCYARVAELSGLSPEIAAEIDRARRKLARLAAAASR